MASTDPQEQRRMFRLADASADAESGDGVPGRLSADEVRERTFPVVLRGFDIDEVREFLAQVADQLLQGQPGPGVALAPVADDRPAEALQRLGDEVARMVASARDSVDEASREADDLRQTAHREAEAVRDGAHCDAAALVVEAREEAQALVAAAKAEAEAIAVKSRRELDELLGGVEQSVRSLRASSLS